MPQQISFSSAAADAAADAAASALPSLHFPCHELILKIRSVLPL
eukprot:CAMPEP_0206616228 /NCGR_PEP_ID=MMETSP0325_2-20121206/58851_1 /ASSEMBLY_ACC=CAM_ASM_000347 /TAXON_ID=2866 /ORGANISM="Crypthecodinium cohnii, Strain Seligo" /LENGTH=43 /DNA_ID= /DNA_START= /DNA_END= /DNA_ORIENTATION=